MAIDRAQLFGCLALLLMGVVPFGGAIALVTPETVVFCGGLACPDLTAQVTQSKIQYQTFAVTDCAIVEGEIAVAGTPRKLLRFSSFTPNIGQAPLVLGDPANGPNQSFYEFAPCHGHYHFKDYAHYRLWKPDDYTTWKNRRADPQWASIPSSFLVRGLAADGVTALPVGALNFVAGHKQGFCAIDIVNVPKFPNTASRTYTVCGNMTTPGNQGISVGWADEYVFSLDGQWIDVTDVASGTYTLEVESNPGWQIEETNYLDNSGILTVKIP